MARKVDRKPKSANSEVCDIVLKSGFTGVAATVLAVAISSPAGLGGMIGTSLASNFGLDPVDGARDGENLVSFANTPAPLTETEIVEIRDRLAASMASVDAARAETDDAIAQLRELASNENALAFNAELIAPVSAAIVVEAPRDPNQELAELLLRGTSSDS